MKKIKAITIIGIMAISLGVHLWGMRKDLPYSARFSDTLFSSLAVKMASTGDPNPHWFGNPGSTVIYPLAVIYHVHHCLFEGGRFFHANPGITLKGDVTDAKYIYIGRLWTILFGVLTVPFIYLLGRDVFGSRIGLVGAFLYSFYPLAVSFAQTLRTDSPATFLGVLAVWLMIRLYTKPSFKNQILAGIAIGLAVSTRYFMATLIPILLLVDVFIFIRAGKEKQSVPWDQFLAGIAVSGFAFALTTPFFILDFSQALSSIRYEARSTHPGADGLSPFGNLIFYFKIIFQELRWPQTVFLLLGTVFAYRHLKGVVVLGVIGTFLAGISINHLHWDRWVIEALPFMALLTAFGLEISVMKVLARVNFWKYGYNLPICILAVILAALPADALIKNDIMQTRYSTAIIARQWVLDHIPLGRTIAQEFHAAPMIEKYYKVFNSQFCLSDKPLDFYKENGFEYLVANEAVYGRFFKEPKRYQKEIQFYQELPVKAEEVQVILPTEQHGGPTIKIYRLVKGAGD